MFMELSPLFNVGTVLATCARVYIYSDEPTSYYYHLYAYSFLLFAMYERGFIMCHIVCFDC